MSVPAVSASQAVQVMASLRWVCQPVGSCAHDACLTKIAQARLACYLCEHPILPGELFYPVTVHQGVVVTQVHASCDAAVRR